MASRTPFPRSTSDIKSIADARLSGAPFLLWRDGDGNQNILNLAGRDRVTIGRALACDLTITEDREVSRTHALLELLAERWTVSDDGISTFGTYLNGSRISARKGLSDGDALRVGATVIDFHDANPDPAELTTARAGAGKVPALTARQRDVLILLARSFKHDKAFARPATNAQIAEQLHISISTVKAHLRDLFELLVVEDDLARGDKRVRLVKSAFEQGLIGESEL